MLNPRWGGNVARSSLVNPSQSADTFARRRWLVPLAASIYTVGLGTALVRPVRLPLDPDAALFLHAGWYINQGARLYIDIWDVKPPLVIETSAVLSWLVGGNPLLLAVAGTLVAYAGYIALVWLVSALVEDTTSDERAALAAGMLMLLVLAVFYFPVVGYRIKGVSLALGWGGIYLQRRKRPFMAGLAAAASAGFWQPCLIFPIVVFIMALTDGRRAVRRVLAGGGLTLVAALAPVVAWGAVDPMLEQVVLSHFAEPETITLPWRLAGITIHLRLAAAVVVMGIYAAVRESVAQRGRWPFIAVTLWFLIMVAGFDYDGTFDALSLFICAALGLGLLMSRLAVHARGVAILLAAALLVGSFHFHPPIGTHYVANLYWAQQEPPSCHYRLSHLESRWILRHGWRCPD